ncbi:MAG: ZIP family metal transporter [Clostridia bacterium]|nr:ZIP family metal transporter [Clostridia bacterium]
MSILGWVILITAIAGIGGTGVGGYVGAVLRKDSTKVVSLLLAFAGGVMMAVVCFDLIPKAFKPEGASEQMPLWLVVGGIILGFLVVYLLNLWIDKSTNHEVEHIDEQHPHAHDDLDELIHADHFNKHRREHDLAHEHEQLHGDCSHDEHHHELFVAGVVMAAAIALHNIPEGMVIGASYAGDVQLASSIVGNSGFIIAIVIGLHNIPEGMAVSVPLISGGSNRWKAILVTASTGIPTVIGAILGYCLGLISPVWLCISLAFASGAMLYVVFGELFPESFLMWKSKAPGGMALIGCLVGLVLVYF